MHLISSNTIINLTLTSDIRFGRQFPKEKQMHKIFQIFFTLNTHAKVFPYFRKNINFNKEQTLSRHISIMSFDIWFTCDTTRVQMQFSVYSTNRNQRTQDHPSEGAKQGKGKGSHRRVVTEEQGGIKHLAWRDFKSLQHRSFPSFGTTRIKICLL